MLGSRSQRRIQSCALSTLPVPQGSKPCTRKIRRPTRGRAVVSSGSEYSCRRKEGDIVAESSCTAHAARVRRALIHYLASIQFPEAVFSRCTRTLTALGSGVWIAGIRGAPPQARLSLDQGSPSIWHRPGEDGRCTRAVIGPHGGASAGHWTVSGEAVGGIDCLLVQLRSTRKALYEN